MLSKNGISAQRQLNSFGAPQLPRLSEFKSLADYEVISGFNQYSKDFFPLTTWTCDLLIPFWQIGTA